MRVCEALHNGIHVQRVERKAELPCGIPFLRHYFVYVTPSVWVDSVLSVKKLFIDRYMLLCIPASFISMKLFVHSYFMTIKCCTHYINTSLHSFKISLCVYMQATTYSTLLNRAQICICLH